MVMEILRNGGPLPRDLITRKSLEMPVRSSPRLVVPPTRHCTFGVAHEAGIRFTLDDVATVFERTPR
jgi:dihydroxy-acid dehydratase